MNKGLGLLMTVLSFIYAAEVSAQKTVARWSFNYAYSITDGIGTPNSSAITGNGNVNFDGVKLGANEQELTGDYYLTPVRHTCAGQVASQDDKGAYHEVNAINCDGAALHMTSPVPTPETASNTWYWGSDAQTFPDGNEYSYQNPYNYFEIEADTKAYKDIQLQVKAAGHNSQNQYYAVAYSIDKSAWTVVGDEYLTGTSYNNWRTTTIDLPALDGQGKVYIRLFPAKNWKGAGNSVSQDNQFDLDDVYILGNLNANEASITSISVDGQSLTEGTGYDYELRLPNTYKEETVTFKVASQNGTVKVTGFWEAEEEDIAVKDNGDGTFTMSVPPADNHYDVTFTITPDDGAIVLKPTTTLYLFHAGQTRVTRLTVDDEVVSTTLRNQINTAGDYTATLSGSIFTALPEVSAVLNDGTNAEVTSQVADGVATYTIQGADRTFTLKIEGVYIYTPGEKDEVVTLNYTSNGFEAPGTWSDGLYTLECSSLDGWNGSQFKFNATDHKLSVPGGVVIKQFSFTRFSANYGNGEGITRFESAGATCHIPTKHNYVRGQNTAVNIVLENHQPGAPVEFTITGGNQPYASFELIIEKTNPGTAPSVRKSSAVVNNNHAVVSIEFDREMSTTEASVNGQTVKAVGGNTTLNFPVYDLDYNKTYTLTIATGAARDLFGNGNAETITYDIVVGDRPVATKAAYDYVVSTVEEFRAAVTAVNVSNKTSEASRKVIFVRKGLYDFGSQEVRFDAFNVSLIGESRDGVTLTGVRNGISNPVINLRGDQGVRATGYYIQDLTLQNDFNFRQADKNSGQAVAVYGGNKSIFKNVRMHGNQDTQVTGDRSYFDKCEIHGTVDFICGGGDNFYDQCDLVLENRGGNVIAAPNSSPDLKWGYVFSSCTIKADSTEVLNGAKSSYDAVDGSFHLGRPWQQYPRIAYLNTKMLILPADNGWTSMGTLPTSFYEYGSVDKDGNLIDLSVRGNSPTSTNTYVPVLTQEEAEQYTIGNVLGGADGWLPTDYTQLTSVPIVSVEGKTLSWTADSQVRTYVIFKDGAYLADTAENSYTVTDDGIYTIRTANDMGGMSVESTTVTVGETAISKVFADSANGACHNLSGQRVNDNYKGIVIVNGQKVIRK